MTRPSIFKQYFDHLQRWKMVPTCNTNSQMSWLQNVNFSWHASLITKKSIKTISIFNNIGYKEMCIVIHMSHVTCIVTLSLREWKKNDTRWSFVNLHLTSLRHNILMVVFILKETKWNLQMVPFVPTSSFLLRGHSSNWSYQEKHSTTIQNYIILQLLYFFLLARYFSDISDSKRLSVQNKHKCLKSVCCPNARSFLSRTCRRGSKWHRSKQVTCVYSACATGIKVVVKLNWSE